MKNARSIFWFRQDLRVADNPGLREAASLGSVLPIYILDDLAPSAFKVGEASKVYLHDALMALNETLNQGLHFYKGIPETLLCHVVERLNITHVFWNTCYEPWIREHDARIEKALKDLRIECCTFNGAYLWDPHVIKKEDGSCYQIFSAYKKKAYLNEPRKPLPKPKNLVLLKDHENETTLHDFGLLPNHPWAQKIKRYWASGEEAAHKKLKHFLNFSLPGYKKGRDFPAQEHTSKLSPHLHFGEISPHIIWEAVKAQKQFKAPQEDVDHFLSEIVWREFSAYLLAHFETLPSEPIHAKFKHFPWVRNPQFLKAWQQGKTGYPFIDAGMRELWETGYMHNRVRMCVASFLVKNGMIHWHYGRDWFWECLVDADLANNSASWQWVAGCGADAAPYFRIFNPITQGEKCDPDGDYTRKFVPEVKLLPNKYLFRPWEAPDPILKKAGIVLGENYPLPIVDLAQSRLQALEAYQYNNPLPSKRDIGT